MLSTFLRLRTGAQQSPSYEKRLDLKNSVMYVQASIHDTP